MKQEEIFEKDDEIREDLIQAASEIGRAELKHRLGRLDDIVDQPVVKKRFKLWWAVVAIIAILIATMLLLKPATPDALYAANYSKFKNSTKAVTRGSNGEDELIIAMKSYTDGDYDSANTKFRVLKRTYPEVEIYEGIIAMENEDFTKASEILRPLASDDNFKFQDAAKWYLALSSLRTDHIDEAKELLQGLSNGSSTRTEKAAKLLKKL